MAFEADITEPELAQGAVQDAVDRFGRLDVLVNNAGIMLLNSALHTTLDEWDRMIALNVSALVHVTHAAVPYLIDAAATSPRQVADLVNVGSTAGRIARPQSSVYALTKFGLKGFTESLRQELLAEHVRVGIVEPGTVDTELVDHLGDVAREAARRQVAAIETLRADDVADADRLRRDARAAGGRQRDPDPGARPDVVTRRRIPGCGRDQGFPRGRRPRAGVHGGTASVRRPGGSACAPTSFPVASSPTTRCRTTPAPSGG